MDGHRCEGRSFEARVRNWGARRGPGKEFREFVNLVEKEITVLSVLTSTQNAAFSVAGSKGRWCSRIWAVVASRSCRCVRIPFHLPPAPRNTLYAPRHLKSAAGIGRAAGPCGSCCGESPRGTPSHLCFLIV